MWLELKVSEWIMIGAVLAGPMIAVLITRIHDARSERRSRKLNVLRSLLRTRQIRIDPEHVGALNLIDIEFYGSENIITAYGKYINHLSTPAPVEAAEKAYFDERHDLFVALLHAIGSNLGYKFDKHDLDRRGYTPIAWSNEQERQSKNAALLTELLEGRRSLPVFNLHSAEGLFPQAPTVNKEP